MRHTNVKSLLRIVLKLGLAGAVICAIWFLALTQDPVEPVGEVAPAHADVNWFQGKDGGEFTRAMASLGLKPRPYDLNGNVIYFASGTADKTPTEIEGIVQDTLVQYGVNSKDYSKEPAMGTEVGAWQMPKDPNAQADWDAFQANIDKTRGGRDAMMNGEVITTIREPSFVRMVGVDWNQSVDEVVERMKSESADATPDLAPKSLMGGYKFVEAMYDPGSGKTDITAVWTGKEFDARKMDNTAFVQQEADPNVPACIGCTRDFRMQALDKDEPLRANKWHTLSSPKTTYDFYVKAMSQRGWRISKSQDILDKAAEIVPQLAAIQGKILNLEKDGKTMQIAFVPDGQGGTDIFSQERFEEAMSTIPK